MGKLTNTTAEVQQAVTEQPENAPAGTAGWDDIPTSTLAVKKPQEQAPEDRFWNHGIADGVTFPTLGFALNELVYLEIQSPHRMKLSEALKQHIHFCTPTDGTGESFRFRLDVIAAGVNEAWTVPTGSPFFSERLMEESLVGKHTICPCATIPAVNTTVSTLYKIKLTRVAVEAPATEYDGEVYVDFIDGHYQSDQDRGSRGEYTK